MTTLTIFHQPWFTQDDGKQTRKSMMFAGSSDPYEGTAILDTADAFAEHGLNPAEASRLGAYLVQLHNMNLERGLVPMPEVPENTYDPKTAKKSDDSEPLDPFDEIIDDEWG